MHKIIKFITYLYFILIWVNPSLAIVNQLPHNKTVQWPTNTWPENFIDIDDKEFSKIINYTFSDDSYGELGRTNALLIIQDGSIVYENYNSPITKDTKLVSYSMAKSYIGLLTGMMIDRGFILSKDETNLLQRWDDNRKNISIGHMLNMQSGLDYVEEYDFGGRSDTLEMLFGQGRFDQAGFASSMKLTKDTYYAAGFGGQYILIIPSKDMIVVRLGETYMEDEKVIENISEIISYFDNRI